MLTRRQFTSGAAAAVATTALAPVLAGLSTTVETSLSDEERDLLSRVPAHGRARIFASLRSPEPGVREVTRLICLATPAERLWVMHWLEADLARRGLT